MNDKIISYFKPFNINFIFQLDKTRLSKNKQKNLFSNIIKLRITFQFLCLFVCDFVLKLKHS